MTENISSRYDDLPKPGYEVVKVQVDEPERKLTLVKLAKPRVGRFVGKPKYGEVDHVMVGSSQVSKADEHGEFLYEETLVLGADADGTTHEMILYLGLRRMTLEEAMFSIGEI